jgi:hypothetical protein
MNPCASYCSNPVTLAAQSYQSGNLGTGAVCDQTTFPISNVIPSNMTGRTFMINGKSYSSGKLPAKVNGGYCFQATAGGYSYASFSTY